MPQLALHIHFELIDLQYLEEVVRKQLYLESELCRKKVTDAIRVIKNKIDLQERRLDRYRQVCVCVLVIPMLANLTCNFIRIFSFLVHINIAV